MGAGRSAEPGTPGTCDGCTLCCVIFGIDALGKPPYHPCRHIGGGGCTIHRAPTRPQVCGGFLCRYIQAHRDGTTERDLLPHPREAGAFVFERPGSRSMVVCVDADRPQVWRSSRLVAYLQAALDCGFTLVIHDRGYAFTIAQRAHLDEVVAQDCVRVAEAMGIGPNDAAFEGFP